MTYHAPAFESKICPPGELTARAAALARPLVFTNGCFDILHRGHVTYLAQAAALGASMVVALNSDASVKRQGKGDDRPVNTLADRLAVMAALGCVALVTWFDEDTPLQRILDCRPEILVKGGDWPVERIVGGSEVVSWGGTVHSIPFIHEKSTTALLEKDPPPLGTTRAAMTTDSEAPAPEQLQAPQRARLFLLIGIPILAFYGIGALREANWPLLALIAINGAVIGASYLALLRGKLGLATIRPGIATYAALLLYMVAFSGEEHGHALWFFSFPLVAIMLLPPREGIVWSGLCIAGAAALMLFGLPDLGTSVYSAAFAIRFVVTAVLITGGTFWSEIVLRRYQEETVAQRHATEEESRRLKAEIERRTGLEAKLRVLATTDVLTGLMNRRSFMERLGQEVARAQRHGQTPTLLMLDIDHFKKINDNYGHPAGDAVLVHLGELLKASLRNVDLVGRLGGEEFGLVLVETNAAMAAPVIERLLEQIRNTTVTLSDATTIRFTASIGSTEILWGDTVDTAIQRADEALYTAKHSGRDRHCQR